MKSLKDQLTVKLSAAFEQCGYDAELGAVTVSNRPDLCQFQCNGAMAGAKRYKKNPAVIAQEIVACVKDDAMFAEVAFCPPGFININLAPVVIAGYVNELLTNEPLGLDKAENPLTIVLDYGGYNVAKELHIGHLRPTIIGEALKRIAGFTGHKTIADVHLGDWGLPMGQIIALMEERMPSLPYFDAGIADGYPVEAPITFEELSVIYPEASAKCKEDETFLEKARVATAALQAGRPGYRALWRHFVALSVADEKELCDALNIQFDYWLGESDAVPYVEPMIEDLTARGLAFIDQGALVVDVKQEEDKAAFPPVIVRKSNGAAGYATTDMATIVQRVNDFNPDLIWYVTDARQSLHFEQVFRAAKKSGLNGRAGLEHHPNGTMNGADGKPFKTRTGGVMPLRELIDMLTVAARAKIEEVSGDTLSEDEKVAVSHKVGVAALKYADLSNHRTKDYIFDLERFVSFEGKTGPYLLYTVVRINSILRKADESGYTKSTILSPRSMIETELMLELAGAAESVRTAFDDRAPNHITEQAYKIAALSNKYYGEHKILTEPDEAMRGSMLSLIGLCRDMLSELLGLLGIETVEKM